MAAAAIAVPSPKSPALASRELSSSFLSGTGTPLKCFQVKTRRKKDKNELNLVVAAAATSGEARSGGRFYFNFTGFPFPLGPFLNCRTLRYDSCSGVSGCKGHHMVIRTRASAGFQQCLDEHTNDGYQAQVRRTVGACPNCSNPRVYPELGAPVESIVLPTFAYEHKIFVGPFSRKFPKALRYGWCLGSGAGLSICPFSFSGFFVPKHYKTRTCRLHGLMILSRKF